MITNVREASPLPDAGALNDSTARTRLGEVLVAHGRLDARKLEQSLIAQSQIGGLLGEVQVQLGLVSELDVARALAAQLGIALLAAEDFPETAVDVQGLTDDYLIKHRLVPLGNDGQRLSIAMLAPQDGFLIKAITLATGLEVTPAVALESDLVAALTRLYADASALALPVAADATAPDHADEQFIEHLRDLASEAPVITLVSRLIARVVDLRASDIHLEPFEDGLQVRYRVDGALLASEREPSSVTAAVTSRIKLLAHLDIAERRMPQDGRIRTQVKGHELDLRVSTLPTVHGESVVLRVLDQASLRVSLEDMGFSDDTLATYRALVARPHGIVLVTGPTGSGKTTTLYASLARLDTAQLKIVTVEDPVEYRIDGINQVQVQAQIGLSFSQALRAILRQDPDVIMIGEMRDAETARIAVQSALTGHLVLSTLHTNSATGAVIRLVDMGIEPYLITSSVSGVMAQRLVRRLCPACAQPAPNQAAVLTRLGVSADRLAGARLHTPVGCPHCRQTGYHGRIAVHELLVLDGPVREAVMQGCDDNRLQQLARAAGMRSLRQDGLDKVVRGETSLEEVLRVTGDSADA